MTKPYFVDELTVPAEFEAVIDETLAKVKKIGAKISSTDYKDITVFVDPIDGTREFATGQGDKVGAPRTPCAASRCITSRQASAQTLIGSCAPLACAPPLLPP